MGKKRKYRAMKEVVKFAEKFLEWKKDVRLFKFSERRFNFPNITSMRARFVQERRSGYCTT